MSNLDLAFDADAAVREVVPRVVARHRAKGTLTWSLLHKLEEEVLSEVMSMGWLSERLLALICAPAALSCPDDDRPVSFGGRDSVPSVFAAIEREWQKMR